MVFPGHAEKDKQPDSLGVLCPWHPTTALSQQWLETPMRLTRPWGSIPSSPAPPTRHQPSSRPSASMAGLCLSPHCIRPENRDLPGCLPILGARCWQRMWFEDCEGIRAAQRGLSWGSGALLCAVTTLPPEKVKGGSSR